MEENFGTRLKLFMESIGMQSSQFADSCEIPRPSFSQLLSGRNQKVSDVLIRKIHSVFPDLSIMWLMFGEGTMLKEKVEKSSAKIPDGEILPDNTKIPSQIPEISTTGRQKTDYSNVKGLTSTESAAQGSIFQQLEDNKKIMELQMQIENMQKNQRRVAQITVYYDDSTFETFVPSKR